MAVVPPVQGHTGKERAGDADGALLRFVDT